ncbi:hypothetical protein PRZ48_015040 [Zasmidium cellare]|uniref:Myb-like domain-containing protein n=1 Tax=Zasmidium cellare TaxID=395010 RepID=A0ABR0DXY1_ZASCE|nr:hypothetical protein PRZ48_015040 [Zasmidium cellare]
MAKITGASTAPSSSAPARTLRRTRSQSAEPAATAPAPQTTAAVRTRGGRTTRASSEQAEDGRRRKNNAAPAVADLTTVEEDEDDDEDAQLQAHIAQSQAPPSEADHADTRTTFNRRRISTASAISGTTAKTSFSQEEIEQMDPEIMIDALPTLATAADEFAHFLAPDGSETSSALWKDIRTAGTRLSKIYDRRQTPFNFHKRSFGSQEYIQPRNVLRAFLGVHSMEDVPKAPWRPDHILFKANLAEMLNTVLITCDTDQWTSTGSDALERLHAAFPDAIAGNDFDFTALAYYLDLTAQLTIRRMDASIESEPNFSPHAVVDNLFYDDDGTFRHMEELGLTRTSDENRDRALQVIQKLAEELNKPFRNRTGSGAAAANGKLKAKYRWDLLKMHTLKYFEERRSQLTERIAKAGGVAKISEALTQEVERRKDLKVADGIRLSHKKPQSTPRTSLAGMAALKQLEESDSEDELAPLAPAASQAMSVQPRGREDEAEAGTEELEEEPEEEPEQQPEIQLELELEPEHESGPAPASEPLFMPQSESEPQPEPQRHVEVVERDFAPISPSPGKASVKSMSNENFRMASSFQERQRQRQRESSQRSRGRFIDPQPNAVFVEWNEDELSQQGSQRPAASQFRDPRISPSKGKRTRTQVEEDEEEEEYDNIPDPTQDEGFQTDTRDMSTANQRRKEVSFERQTRPLPRYRPLDTARSTAGPSNYRSTAPEPEPRPSPAKRQRLNPGSSVVPVNEPVAAGDRPLSVDELYARSKIYARQNSVVAYKPKAQQQRRQWSDEEEAALMKLIEEHGGDGISYSTLKNLDAALEDDAKLELRSAEDLRFKARNMKVTLLVGLGGQENLPANWEYVMLDKKAIDKLRQKGVPYTQDRQRDRMY